jgi:prepilin-type N-terminal cleavage/methylation domain-containing protein
MYSDMNTNKSQRYNRGFTLIEMLIAVFIFTVAMAALTVMAGRGIRASTEAQERITAEFLAVEGIEVVRNIRDSAFLSGLSVNSWTGVFGGNDIFGPDGCFNFEDDANQEKTCRFTYNASGQPELDTCDQCVVYLGSQGYENDSGTPGGVITPFVRKIYINQVDDHEIKVRVTVEWGTESIEFQDTLFLWG